MPWNGAVTLVIVTVLGALASPLQFRSRVDGVVVHASVTHRNRPVLGLSAADFALTDDGVPQRIVDVSQDRLPLDLTLVVDTSGAGVLHVAIGHGVARLRGRLRSDDRARLIAFDGRAVEPGPFGPAPSLPPLPAPRDVRDGFSPAGGTALFDTLVHALSEPPAPDRRQLVILFSAGRDTTSIRTAADVLDLARRSDTTVFAIHAWLDFQPVERMPDGARPLPRPVDRRAVPRRFYQQLTEITGGTLDEVKPLTMFRYDTDKQHALVRFDDGISSAFLRAIDDFRSSYVIRFTPERPAPGWHVLSVRVTRPGARYTVRARKGYLVQ